MRGGAQHRYRVTVLVLGDLGRSPRMLNHALALAEDGAEVSLAGYSETAVDDEVARHPAIRLFLLRPPGRARQGSSALWFIVSSMLRALLTYLRLSWLLLVRTPRPDTVLVQNPPSIPTLPVGWAAARLRGTRLVIDWHNFGYSMLALRLGPAHPAVRTAKRFEQRFAGRGDAHFCVSRAMREVLTGEFGLKSPSVLYDRPRKFERPLGIAERSVAAAGILARAGVAMDARAAIAICPTSFTADEDMDLLLDGLVEWDSSSRSQRLLVLITGRGPSREAFEKRLGGVRWRSLEAHTLFLDPADYRELLRAAHFGICMHRSASGVDLPMKLMDLFGARTPVCAFDYGECLAEQLEAGRTGLTFRTGSELAECLEQLLEGFPERAEFLETMQRNIEAACRETWMDAWRREAAPVFHRLAGLV